MQELRVRNSVRDYVRDTYIGSSVDLNPELVPIDCAIGSSQWGMSARAIAAHRSFDVTALESYADPFHARLAKKLHERFGLTAASAPLFFGHGSFNLAERVIHKLVAPSTMIGIGPQFNEIPSEFVAAGGTYVPIAIERPQYAFPIEGIIRRLGADASLVYIDNPNNPTGRMMPPDTIADIAQAASKSGTIVLVDEAYGDFVEYDQSSASLVPFFSNMIVTRSFSKALGLAAARVGYMFASAGVAELYRGLDVPFEPSLHSVELAIATLDDLDFIRTVRSCVARSKSILVEALGESGFEVLPTHPQTSILSVRAHGGNAVQAFASIAVTVEPGSAFVHTHTEWDDSYCRLRLPKEELLPELTRRIKSLTAKQRNSRHAHQS